MTVATTSMEDEMSPETKWQLKWLAIYVFLFLLAGALGVAHDEYRYSHGIKPGEPDFHCGLKPGENFVKCERVKR